MKNRLTHFLTVATFLSVLLPMNVAAQDCANAASQAASESSAEVLNVVALGDGSCEITLRIPGQDGQPPRVVTKQVSG